MIFCPTLGLLKATYIQADMPLIFSFNFIKVGCDSGSVSSDSRLLKNSLPSIDIRSLSQLFATIKCTWFCFVVDFMQKACVQKRLLWNRLYMKLPMETCVQTLRLHFCASNLEENFANLWTNFLHIQKINNCTKIRLKLCDRQLFVSDILQIFSEYCSRFVQIRRPRGVEWT